MSTPVAHHSIEEDDWRALSLCQQLGNVSSEVGRALSARSRGKEARAQSAFERGLELLDLTIADPKHRTRLKELCRAREVVCDFFVGGNQYSSSADSLDRYFLQFAQAAQLQKVSNIKVQHH